MNIGLGIDVGGSKILACAIDADGNLLGEKQVDSPNNQSELVAALSVAIVDIDEQLQQISESISCACIGLPGLVDENDVLNETPNIPSAEGLDLKKALTPLLHEAFNVSGRSQSIPRIAVENDATCAAAGEWAFGAARSRSDAIVVTLGTGIGGGLIVNGAVARGARGFAGEIGHMVINPDGPPCACGNHGCWEQYASGTGLQRLAREAIARGGAVRVRELAGERVVHGEHVVTAAQEGDGDALELIGVFSHYLAIGLSNLIEILDPACVILSGGMSRASEIFLEPTRRELATFRRGSGVRGVEIVIAELQERAGAFGAGALAMGIIA